MHVSTAQMKERISWMGLALVFSEARTFSISTELVHLGSLQQNTVVYIVFHPTTQHQANTTRSQINECERISQPPKPLSKRHRRLLQSSRHERASLQLVVVQPPMITLNHSRCFSCKLAHSLAGNQTKTSEPITVSTRPV
jgi:hypothetical protein